MKGRGVKCSPSNMLCFVFYPLFWRLLIIIGAAAAALQSPLVPLIFSLNFHLIGEWHDKRELRCDYN